MKIKLKVSPSNYEYCKAELEKKGIEISEDAKFYLSEEEDINTLLGYNDEKGFIIVKIEDIMEKNEDNQGVIVQNGQDLIIDVDSDGKIEALTFRVQLLINDKYVSYSGVLNDNDYVVFKRGTISQNDDGEKSLERFIPIANNFKGSFITDIFSEDDYKNKVTQPEMSSKLKVIISFMALSRTVNYKDSLIVNDEGKIAEVSEIYYHRGFRLNVWIGIIGNDELENSNSSSTQYKNFFILE